MRQVAQSKSVFKGKAGLHQTLIRKSLPVHAPIHSASISWHLLAARHCIWHEIRFLPSKSSQLIRKEVTNTITYTPGIRDMWIRGWKHRGVSGPAGDGCCETGFPGEGTFDLSRRNRRNAALRNRGREAVSGRANKVIRTPSTKNSLITGRVRRQGPEHGCSVLRRPVPIQNQGPEPGWAQAPRASRLGTYTAIWQSFLLNIIILKNWASV